MFDLVGPFTKLENAIGSEVKTRTTCKISTIFKDLNFLNPGRHLKIGTQTLPENIVNHLNIWNFRAYLSHIFQLSKRVRRLCESSNISLATFWVLDFKYEASLYCKISLC